jgi:hypothetical protein
VIKDAQRAHPGDPWGNACPARRQHSIAERAEETRRGESENYDV